MKAKSIIIMISLVLIGLVCLWLAIESKDQDTKGYLYNISSSSFLVFLIELIAFFRDLKKNSFLSGTFKRIQISYEDVEKKTDSKYGDLTPRYIEHNVIPEITLKHQGDGKYTGFAYYDEGKTKITLNLDTENHMIGTGTYQYINKSFPDLGTYSFQVDESKNTLYVFYSNLLPSGLAKGYEIWKR